MSSKKLDAVLPLMIKDYERFKILDKSLKLFFKDLGKCWIVTPDKEFEKLKSWISDSNYHLIPETSLIPEFKFFRETSGWFKQQLIKIAIAEKIETDFYLTLDADVICTKPVYFSDLVKNERAICYTINNKDLHHKWYKWAERVLSLNPQRSGVFHNVTPAVISKVAMKELQKYLFHLSQEVNFSLSKKDLVLFLAKLFPKFIRPKYLVDWRIYLLRSLPWTEYALYYMFVEEMNLFEKYHVQVEQRIYSKDNSVWYQNEISSWNPEQSFNGVDKSFFIVVQSNTNISPNEIWEKVGIYLE